MDERGARMWKTITGILDEVKAEESSTELVEAF
jgi:hypothetical protein